MSKKYGIQTVAAKDGSPAEILVYGPIGKSFWSDEGISAEEFINALNAIPKGNKVVIGINSQGGTIGEGIAMHSAIERRAEDITARIDGYALSAASFFPLAAGRVVTAPSAIWMIHCGWTVIQGNARQMRKDAAMMDTHDQAMALAYTKKTKKSESEMLSLMEAETWMTGKEAITLGLADEEGTAPEGVADLDFSAANGQTFRHIPSFCPRILSAVAKGDKPDTDAQAPSALPPITAPAAQFTPAPMQAANTTTKGTMKKEEIVALLKSRGATVPENATEEQLLAMLKQELDKPKSDPADNADLKAIKAQLEKERKARVTLAIDKHILDNRMPRDERDDAVTRALADETYLDVIAKRPQIFPGADPLNASPTRMTEGPLDEIRRLPTAAARSARMRPDWDPLWKDACARDARRGVLAANTYSADLVTDYLADGFITNLQNRLASLAAFSIRFDLDPKKPLATVQVSHVTVASATVTDATDFEPDNVNTVAAKAITVHQYTQPMHVTNAELQSGLEMAKLVDINSAKFADTILEVVNALITVANFSTHDAIVSAFGAFGFPDLAQAWGLLQKSPIKNAVLNGQYMARILNTPGMFQAAGTEGGTAWSKFGWDRIESNSNWTGAGEGVNGFACNPQAILIGAALPLNAPMQDGLRQSTLAVPGLGISAQQNMWFSLKSRTARASFDIMFGAQTGDTTAGVCIKTS